MSEVWKFLKETLPKYQWNEEKVKVQTEEDQSTAIHGDNAELKEDASLDKNNMSESKSPKKPSKDAKAALSGKDSKADKHKKETKDKKGKPTVEDVCQEDSFTPDFPEPLIFASFTDLPLTKLSAHTEMVTLF
jgi:hypothetical protein